MTDTTKDLPDDEAELLLPFFLNGTLGAAERDRVERWLAENSAAAAHLARVGEELELTRAVAETRGVPSRHVLDDLMTRVGAPPGLVRESLVDRLWALLSPRYALAGAAALCLLILAQAGYILVAQPQAPAQYQTATGPGETMSGPTALVGFADSVDMKTLAARLAGLGLVIRDGPKPGGLFVIGAPDTIEGRAALDELGRAKDLTRFFQVRP